MILGLHFARISYWPVVRQGPTALRPGTMRFAPRLNRHDPVGFMGCVGVPGDNAAMESFLALLQKKALNRRTLTT